MKNVIEVKSLTKEYKKIKAIDDLSFNVKKVRYQDFQDLMEVVT